MKTLPRLFIILFSFVVVMISYMLLSFLLRESDYAKYRKERIVIEKQVLDNVFESQLIGLINPAKTNAVWDELVSFCRNKNFKWAEHNLNPLVPLFDLAFIAVYDKHRHFIYFYSGNVAYKSEDFILKTDEIEKAFKKSYQNYFFLKKNNTFFFLYGIKIVPSYDASFLTPAQGYLFFAKAFDRNFINSLRANTGFFVEIIDKKDNLPDYEYVNDSLVIYKHLTDNKGNIVGSFKFSKYDAITSERIFSSTLIVFMSLFAFVVLLIFFIALRKWIAEPLSLIINSLKNESPSILKPILNKKNEFALIAQLIQQFHVQKQKLIEEIEDRKTTEQALMESELRYFTLIQYMPDLIIIHIKGKIVYCNDSIKNYGYTSADVIGMNVLDFVAEADKPKVIQAIENRYNNKYVPEYELAILDKEGNIHYCIVKGDIISYEGQLAVFNILIDVTESILTTQKLRISEEKFRSTIEQSTDGIVLLDSKCNIVEWNKGQENISGYTKEEMLGRKIWEFLEITVSPEDPNIEEIRDCIQNFKEISENPETELRHKRRERLFLAKNNIVRYISSSIFSIKTNYETFYGIITQDITSIKVVEIQLKMAIEEAERANKAKSTFLANMSHEIRTPLNGIIGMTDLCLTTELNEQQREYLEAVKKSSYTLLDIINDVIDFSKIEAGKLEIENIKFNLREVVENTIDIFITKAAEKNIELVYNFPLNIEENLYGDPIRIKQVLMNLISNAIKFTDEGYVKINVEKTFEDQEKIEIKFSVKDTGIGIPDDKKEIIFQSFTQADSSTTRKYGGSGLGLTISKNLCEMMGGTLKLESKVNEGSIFYFVLPFKKAIISEEQKTEPILIKNALIFTDNSHLIEIFEENFNLLGINTIFKENIFDSLYIIDNYSSKCDIIIIDYKYKESINYRLFDALKEKCEHFENLILLIEPTVDKYYMLNKLKNYHIKRIIKKPLHIKEIYQILLEISYPEKYTPTTSVQLLKDYELVQNCIALIAEDIEINQKILTEYLGKFGISVIIARNGREAVEKYKQNKVDLIFMDVHMPEIDGLEATKMIREIERNTNTSVPIIAVTADAMKGDMEKCINAGMDFYISKPYKIQDIEYVIKKFINIKNKIIQDDLVYAFSDNIDQDNEINRIFDENLLLRNTEGDKKRAQSLIEGIVSSIPERLENLEKAIQELDFKEIEYYAHSIKGLAAFGASSLMKDIAAEIENYAREKNPNKEYLLTKYNLLVEVFEMFEDEVRNKYLK